MTKGFNRSRLKNLRFYEKISTVTDEQSLIGSTFIEDILNNLREVEDIKIDPFELRNSKTSF